MPKFSVKIRTTHDPTYLVEAPNAEAAFAAIAKGDGVMIDSGELAESTSPELWQIIERDFTSQKPKTLAEILAKKICKKHPDEDQRNEVLDELVHDVASSGGSDVNNEGTLGQIEFLIQRLGTGAWKDIKEAFGDDLDD